ncbi:MAG: hypothetical protein R3324_20590, partial [Halobacteriales archaeon]|nr:hypothetical protein [Halobacteriales archaeon]
MRAIGDGTVEQLDEVPAEEIESGWLWVDVIVGEDELSAVTELTTTLDLDVMAVRDAVEDFDLPKVDDFGHHL